ncbi:MAG TPA: sn-glycerol-3-phosphate import ATP-binding protein UgpC [Pararhizobium sp.]|nr:sn-glycerol-3-phosphate import ATP-binding protein UgpC [Pararhizobium sp.]
MARIHIDNARKVYAGNVEAVKGVSLDITDGELVVLVGPSGCGKSTLLRMVAGLETITSGEISIGDRVVNDVNAADRDIAMVFQNYALYPHMTVRDNLAYGLKNRGAKRAEIDKRVGEAAKILEIADFLNRKPRQLSGGQRQRVAMGRAIVRDPAAFLFDEPLSNLDAKLRVQMRGEIKQLQRRLKTTALYVTHDQLEAMTLADRLVVLNKGQIEQVGRPLDVYRQPATTFVAGFIGSPAMNLLATDIAEGSVRIGNGSAPRPERLNGLSKVVVGLRPEDASLAGSEVPARLTMDVDYVEDLGAERLVHGHSNGQLLTISVDPDAELHDTISVAINDATLHFFDIETGQRI